MVKKEEFTFDSRDGATKIHAVRWVPEGKVVCILQIIHGMAEYVERYEQLAQYLGEKGILVTGDDHLGHGKSVGEEGAYGYFCEQDPATVVVRDVHRLKKITQEEYPGIPYVILGHSMGSFILRNYLFRYGNSGRDYMRNRLPAESPCEVLQADNGSAGGAPWAEACGKND